MDVDGDGIGGLLVFCFKVTLTKTCKHRNGGDVFSFRFFANLQLMQMVQSLWDMSANCAKIPCVGIVFLGGTIIYGWVKTCSKIWEPFFANFNAIQIQLDNHRSNRD